MITFSKDFLWGAAASAPQTEGAALVDGKSPTVWDKWFELEPELFYEGVGPEQTSNTYYQYKEDVALMKKMALNSYRTSISWARILPDGRAVNVKAVQFYRDYFQEMKSNGIEPIINLFHFDMPWWLMEKGGWETRESIEAFAFYAQVVFEQFGDIIKKWTTFNEPLVHVECGYLGEAHYPKVVDFTRAIQVGYHTLLAHAMAVNRYKNSKYNDGEIGIILNLSPVYPKSTHVEDKKAAHITDLIYIRSFLDTVVHGYFPEELIQLFKTHQLLPKVEEEDKEIFQRNIVDFLGVNYYQPLRVQRPKKEQFPAQFPSAFASHYDWPNKKINPYRGWEIYPEGIYDLGMRLKNEYKNISWYVSENGMGVSEEERFLDESGVVQDSYRIDFLKEHLIMLQKAISEGSNCFGYHMWTFVDCWSWLNAYKNRYGFYRIDLENQFKRSEKASSLWLKQVIVENGFPMTDERKG
ncbi:hypothetical protein RV11_GL000457 [Enterococcus phoeniculicola]|jgi:6-phospho-beta-glucosidase|uniref:Beta-glucosidase n=1 Tax=Enterococcus phoeniculicola ATCC BAA-412 TaxID=1158610 RepID=R3U2P7_9ENTE|nr:glycoside hydrolase family 1 protein [Enterococcus phoeniculicola]EOL47653.1 hypothetical protein UC3_00656 [Enterococcus phoeniculicola ATCC BAA-412]EOT72948.1 hypothetical protein I589_03219 [Enterococcus phoeniculicola ATCC BAA-412]OJG71442.1 hypothetical protein RV11_GL000457 [Enterococcus phoeniculicola]